VNRHEVSDSWFWDIVMYLGFMDIEFYKAPSGGSSHRGTRKNPVLQQFPDGEGVVQNRMDDMFMKTGELNAAGTKAASN
jgi:hypothetical protein